jgi:hypothetical protein
MKWSDFETRIKPEMLNGKAFALTITKVVQETVHPQPNQSEEGTALYFKETNKSIVLNAVNRRTLWRLFGDETQACIDQRIKLYTEPRSRTDSRLVIRIGRADAITNQPTVDTATGEVKNDETGAEA